jgi:hypothetical protein
VDGSVGLTADLAATVGIPVRQVGSLELIAAGDSGPFLDACSAAGIRVLGIEGFRLSEGVTRPDMSAIADLSRIEKSSESVEAARSFVQEVATSDLMLEFTLAGEGGVR